MRAYDKEKDSYYSPDDTPELYLTEQQVKEALDYIAKHTDSPEEFDVRILIAKVEELNRKEKLGSISESECRRMIEKITDDFADKYDFWPYITKTFTSFYKYFIK